MRKPSEKRSIDFGVKPFKKGLAGFKRTESFACTGNRYLKTFHGSSSVPVTFVPRSGTQNIVLKEKVAVSGVLSEGRSLLQSAPLLRNNPPDCFAIHSPQSALRIGAKPEACANFQCFRGTRAL